MTTDISTKCSRKDPTGLTPPKRRVVLGSSSKWRLGMLKEMYPNLEFTTLAPDIDEKAIRHEDVRVLPLIIAEAKLKELLTVNSDEIKDSLLICSDQIVCFDGKVREKPVDEKEARAFLESYRTQPATTIAALVVHNTATGKSVTAVDEAVVNISGDLPDAAIDSLIAKGDIFTCCGGFTIDDPVLFAHITSIDGTRSSVEGLPKEVLHRLLHEAEAA